MPGVHKRFDSVSDGSDHELQEPLAASLPVKQVDTQPLDLQDASDSDSDAPPEAVSASAALSAAKAARQKASAAARRVEDLGKQKRKQLEASRVKQTKERRKVKETRTVAEDQAEEEEEDEDEDDGPAPLPLEILAAAETERKQAVLQSLQASQRADEQRSRKRKFDNLTKARSIKDARVGSTTVRVLATQSKTLPPKNTVRKLSVRDAVLAGIKSRTKGPTKFASLEGARRPWKNEFLKKK